MKEFFAFPTAASTMAPRVDAIFWTLCVLTLFVVLGLGTVTVYFLVRYRERHDRARRQAYSNRVVEAIWIGTPLLVFVALFAWGAREYVPENDPPPDAMAVFGIAKQWMWKFEHADGRREMNALHVPVGRPVRVTLVSQDVIHSFFVPAFRLKQDVLPGRYTTTWFQASRPGTYRLFCAEYCGTDHSAMLGTVVAMAPEAFARWQSETLGQSSLAYEGRKRFQVLGCTACHGEGASSGAPSLEGLYGRPVDLEDGSRVTADDNYLRTAILEPGAQVVLHYRNVMPSYRGLVDEVALSELVAYVKSLATKEEDLP